MIEFLLNNTKDLIGERKNYKKNRTRSENE